MNMNRQVWISDEAYEYARKIAFEQKKYIGQVVSEALLNGVKQ